MIKTRVYEVAREMGLDNRELMTKLATLGIQVRNHMSSLEPIDIERVKRSLDKDKQQNVVEERIRPTVVRRRSVKKDDDEELDAKPAAAGSAPAPVAARSGHGGHAERGPESAPVRAPARDREEPRRAPVAASPAPAAHGGHSASAGHGGNAGNGGHAAQAAHAAPAASPVSAPAERERPASAVRPAVRETPREEAPAVQTREAPEHAPRAAPAVPPPAPAPVAERSVQPVAAAPAPTQSHSSGPAPTASGMPSRPIQSGHSSGAPHHRHQHGGGRPSDREGAHMSGGGSGGPQVAQRRGPALSVEQRLGMSDLPPGVVARGSIVGNSAAPLSAAARSRIIAEHAAKTAQLQGGGPAGATTPPRRRELVRSALGPTGRQQQQRGRPGRARKMAPGKKGAKTEITTPSAAKRVIRIEDEIGLQVLAARMSLKATDVLAKLMELGTTGVMINSTLDADTANILAAEFGFEVENVAVTEDDLITEARGTFVDDAGARESRPPVVTVMGHVDHGKTSLLDRIRRTNVASQESGGITQHIGAYRVETKKGTISFIDTPGHAAFTAMRSRGATATDLVILVVAADDGVMPQTKEAISHAKAAKVPIIVAINKMDKPDARPDVIMRDLASEGLQSEEWGGDTMFYKVSAQTGDGVEQLLDGVLLQSEVMELRANPNVPAEGVVLEAYLDKGRGPVANLLIQDGELSTGSVVVVGSSFGKIRAMTDDRGKPVAKAGPSMPVEVLGLSEVPEAGDRFNVVTDIKVAQQISERRRKVGGRPAQMLGALGAKVGLDALFQKMQEGDLQELKLVVKADVQGSAEALVKALTELSTDKVRVVVIHSGAGGITESDVMLASASRAIVVGFHVRASGGATKIAKAEQVEVRTYSIIYEAVDDVKNAMVGLLKPTFKESSLGRAEVRAVFTLPKGVIAGSYVLDGKMVRGAKARLLRDSQPIWEGSLRSLRRIKEDVKDVAAGFECGIGLDHTDIKERDVIECFELQEVTAQL
ncbi:MAG TPA: translation initiation factor IF-2 [Polyangiales bacterium]|nr:translation initiation factor IF-2 [Polyangiales bacterium]